MPTHLILIFSSISKLLSFSVHPNICTILPCISYDFYTTYTDIVRYNVYYMHLTNVFIKLPDKIYDLTAQFKFAQRAMSQVYDDSDRLQ